MIVINVETQSVKTKHICFEVENKGDRLELYKIEESFYDHPNASGFAMISQITKTFVMEAMFGTSEAAPLFLLWNAEQNMQKMIKP